MFFVVLLGKWDSDEVVVHVTSPDKILLIPQDTYLIVHAHFKHESTANKAARILREIEQDPKATVAAPKKGDSFYGLCILRKEGLQYEGLGVGVEAVEEEIQLLKGDYIRLVGTANLPEAAEALATAGIIQTVWYVLKHAKTFNAQNPPQLYQFSPEVQKWLSFMPSSK